MSYFNTWLIIQQSLLTQRITQLKQDLNDFLAREKHDTSGEYDLQASPGKPCYQWGWNR